MYLLCIIKLDLETYYLIDESLFYNIVFKSIGENVMKKMKKVLLLLGVGLMASCGNGTQIQPAEAEVKLQKISESMNSVVFEAPNKFKMTSSLSSETNGEKNLNSATIAIAEKYLYSSNVQEITSTDEQGKKQEEKMQVETWIYIEDKTVYVVQDDHAQNKTYMKQELPSEDAAKLLFDSTAASLGVGSITKNLLSASKIMFTLATQVIGIAKDIDAFLTENEFDSNKFSHELELASKNDGHLYAKFDFTYRFDELGSDDEVVTKYVQSQNMEIEFDKYLPVKMNYIIDASETEIVEGKEVKEFEKMALKAKMEYDFKVSKPDLSKFTLAQ